jgi:hypothetical protein
VSLSSIAASAADTTPLSANQESSITTARSRIVPTNNTHAKNTITTNIPVLYAKAQDAKQLKTTLADAGFLDKRYRMTKQENDVGGEQVVVIAIPVTTECLEQWLANEWSSPLVVGHGQEKEMPLSTSQFARKQKVTMRTL